MKKATLTALKKSIATWARRAQGENILPNYSNCALCQRFTLSGEECTFAREKCPVYEATGEENCASSEAYKTYQKYYEEAFNNLDSKQYAASVMGKRRAQKEVDFLKSLLPE